MELLATNAHAIDRGGKRDISVELPSVIILKKRTEIFRNKYDEHYYSCCDELHVVGNFFSLFLLFVSILYFYC